MKKPKIDQEKCTGCSTCNALCPEVFEVGDDGKSHVKKLDKYDDYPVQDAIDSCPEEAISWEEE